MRRLPPVERYVDLQHRKRWRVTGFNWERIGAATEGYESWTAVVENMRLLRDALVAADLGELGSPIAPTLIAELNSEPPSDIA